MPDEVKRLCAALGELEQGLQEALKLPSRIEEAQIAIYSGVLTLLLDNGLVPSALTDPVCAFLAAFHQGLVHRQKVTTWQYNQYWFAAISEHAEAHRQRLDQRSPHILSEDDEGDRPLIDTLQMGANEEEALEKLYLLHPELR